MTKKTQARMDNIKKSNRLITFNERGTSKNIESMLNSGMDTHAVSLALGVGEDYVRAVKQAMGRRGEV